MRFLTAILVFAASFASAAPASAQDRETPYWASMRAEEVNMRVGPSEEYKIEWVYRRQQLPVKVIRVKEGWRLIRDPDGVQGWVVGRLLNPERTAIVIGESLAPMREASSEASRLLWNLEPGVIGKLGDCGEGWCRLDVGGHKGWVRQAQLWGAGEP